MESTVATRPETPALILYTSGTTGNPKGVVLTHYNLYMLAHSFGDHLCRLTSEDVIQMVPPASHAFGQLLMNMAGLVKAELSLMSQFEPQSFLATIERDRVTFSAGVPRIANVLLNAAEHHPYDLSSLRLMMFGAAILHPEVAARFQERFQVSLCIAYGLTEALPVTFGYLDDHLPAGSVGKATFGTQLRLVNPTGQIVPPGEPGEIMLRGPHLFQAYHNRPDATAAVVQAGWFRTGDMGRLDHNGYLFIVDRLKDAIKTSGYLVFPAEVERVLHTHAAVSEAAVVGIPHQTLGEVIQAFVVLKEGHQISAKALIDYCKGQLSRYKCPCSIRFEEQLPQGPSGKILRRVLRDRP